MVADLLRSTWSSSTDHRDALARHPIAPSALRAPPARQLSSAACAAAGPALTSRISRRRSGCRWAEELVAERWNHRRCNRRSAKSSGRGGEVRGADAELQRGGATSASLPQRARRRPGLAALRGGRAWSRRRRAPVKFDRPCARNTRGCWRCRASVRRRASSPAAKLRLQRLDEHLEEVRRRRVHLAADRLAVRLVDHQADHERPAALARRSRLTWIALLHALGVSANRIVTQWNWDPRALREEAVAETSRR